MRVEDEGDDDEKEEKRRMDAFSLFFLIHALSRQEHESIPFRVSGADQ